MKRYKSMSQFVGALQKMDKQVRTKALGNSSEAGARVVEGHAKVNISLTFKKQIGNLANSIVVDTRVNNDKAVSSVGPTAIYGRIQELGGTVKPVRARLLHWVDESGKHHVAREVTLPARPYLVPALENNQDDVLDAMAENLRIEIEGAL